MITGTAIVTVIGRKVRKSNLRGRSLTAKIHIHKFHAKSSVNTVCVLTTHPINKLTGKNILPVAFTALLVTLAQETHSVTNWYALEVSHLITPMCHMTPCLHMLKPSCTKLKPSPFTLVSLIHKPMAQDVYQCHLSASPTKSLSDHNYAWRLSKHNVSTTIRRYMYVAQGSINKTREQSSQRWSSRQNSCILNNH